jgi:hypothetical protein
MRLICRALLLSLLAPGLANAQAADDMRIYVAGYQLTTNGAEKHAGVSRGVVVGWSMGKPAATVFSMIGCGDFSVTMPPAAFSENATAGWRVEITPTKVAADHAVTFRLRWVRALDTGQGFTPASEDLELTLKPGESRPLDSVAVPATAKTSDGRPCTVKTASLRLSVEFNSSDRRMIGADVWLVERLANGKEDSQLQSVRAMPHEKVPFYFDSITDGTNRFDFFGRLTAELKEGGIEIDVEATRGLPSPGQKGYQSGRFFRSTIQIKPGEIVEVALTPRFKDEELPNRVFSLRIRAKQIR